MPGGRLTHQDRQHIASSLTEGLGYAEIARRLGRPTSTISREVARNGGAHGYRADQAHQATRQRARRHRPAPPEESPAMHDVHGRDHEAVRAYGGQLTELMVHIGLPRMAARVLACLFLTDSASLTAAELVGQLQVSAASVSKAIGYLEGLELVRREREARQRRDRYTVGDDVWFRAWMSSARRNAMWARTAQQGVEIFGAATPTGVRIDQMSRFFARLVQDMGDGFQDWQQFLVAQQDGH
ncbi:MAG: helix-turn-helix domain-containing protein [Kutzneria sp.]|nr:helix-turn-helix domain-containing protein [Kutzneria sp.]MBV9845691.1 helix-turn-helix domain-containing protein [Kutzneria sp.]